MILEIRTSIKSLVVLRHGAYNSRQAMAERDAGYKMAETRQAMAERDAGYKLAGLDQNSNE